MFSSKAIVALAAIFAVSGCAASTKTFYANPAGVKDTQLCRTLIDAAQRGDQQFASDTAREAISRGLTLEQCQQKVATENGVLIATALVATAVGVGIACKDGCGGGGYSAPSYATNNVVDYDCAGGGGNGPRYVQGPFPLSGPDIYGLDADHDGIACEPFQDIGS